MHLKYTFSTYYNVIFILSPSIFQGCMYSIFKSLFCVQCAALLVSVQTQDETFLSTLYNGYISYIIYIISRHCTHTSQRSAPCMDGVITAVTLETDIDMTIILHFSQHVRIGVVFHFNPVYFGLSSRSTFTLAEE